MSIINLLFFSKFLDITMASPPFLVSMERGGRLVMRMGTGNQSNGYVGTTLCLLSLLFHTNSIKKYVNFVFLKILRHHQGISFFS